MVYESFSSDEIDNAEYEAWLDEMNRDMRDNNEFERSNDEIDINF